MTELKNNDLLNPDESNEKSSIKNVLNYKRPTFWISAVALISISIIVVYLISNNLHTSGTLSSNEDLRVNSITLQPINEIIESSDKLNVGYSNGASSTPDFNKPENIVYNFGDGSKVNLTFNPEENPSMNAIWFCDEKNNRYFFDKNGNVVIGYKSKTVTNVVLSIKELEKLSKVYLNKFIGENDYQIVNNGEELIENAKDQTFRWTKYINNIPTQIQEVTIKLALDGNIISTNNIGIVQKNDYIDKLDDITNSSNMHITEEKAIEIAKARCNKDNINIENATIYTKLRFAYAGKSPKSWVENKYQLQWCVSFMGLSYIENYSIVIEANTGEILYE